MTTQDIIFSSIENVIKSYYSKRFPNKKTFDTVLLVDRIVKTKIVGVGQTMVMDGKYKCVDEKDWKEILEMFWAKKEKWTEEWDCDKFAIELKSFCNKLGINSCGIAIGFLNNTMHAFNIYVNSDLQVFIVEPQTGNKCEVENDNFVFIDGNKYKISNIII